VDEFNKETNKSHDGEADSRGKSNLLKLYQKQN